MNSVFGNLEQFTKQRFETERSSKRLIYMGHSLILFGVPPLARIPIARMLSAREGPNGRHPNS